MELKEIVLGDLVELKYGSSLPELSRVNGRVEVYGSNGIVGYHDKAITKGKTIIIGRKGSIGKINLSKDSCFPIDTTYYIDETKKPCDLKWLYYILKTLRLENLNRAAAVPGLNRKEVYGIRIKLPPLGNQQKIVAILEKTEKIKEKRKQTIKLLDEYVKSVFNEMFGDPIINQRNWPVKSLEKVSKKITDGEHITPKLVEKGIPYISAKNVNNQIDFENVDFVDEETYQKITKRCFPEKGDILVTCVGTIGRIKIIDIEDKFVFARSVALIKTNSKLINALFLERLLSLPNMTYNLIGNTNVATVRGLYLRQIKELKIIVPPLSLQQKFASIVENIEQLKEKQNNSFQDIEQLFNVLTQKAFKGELVK